MVGKSCQSGKLEVVRKVLIIKKLKHFIFPVLFLILVDQAVKVIISNAYMQCDFGIIANILRFSPGLNTNLSWSGNFINILSSPLVAILLNILVLFVFLSGYLLYRAKRTQDSFPVTTIMVFGLAGCLCSLIDKLFWGGSLDFLQIPNFFIFDLKDCYLTVAEVLFVIVGILHSKEISVKEYLCFCCNKFKL